MTISFVEFIWCENKTEKTAVLIVYKTIAKTFKNNIDIWNICTMFFNICDGSR